MDHRGTVEPFHRGERLRREGLVERAQGGEVGAFEELYRRHVGHVHALCLRLSADPARAEELTQEAFVRAWEKLPTFQGKSSFETWLHRLAVNVALGERRSLGRYRDRFEQPESEEPPGAIHAAPGSALDLERAISALPTQARAVFVLHDVEGYAHGEIADLCGLSEGTCRSHLHRARKLLREALG
jgi:RNA polymerase sigma-70 factor (ECF subfamily)